MLIIRVLLVYLFLFGGCLYGQAQNDYGNLILNYHQGHPGSSDVHFRLKATELAEDDQCPTHKKHEREASELLCLARFFESFFFPASSSSYPLSREHSYIPPFDRYLRYRVFRI